MSSGSESDEDYVPGEPEKVSEEESADEETESQYEKELEHKTTKRKAVQKSKGKKKKRTCSVVKQMDLEDEIKEAEKTEEVLDPVEEKKREEDLWAKFLEGTDTKPKPTSKEDNKSIETKITSIAHSTIKPPTEEGGKNDDSKNRERRIFEFAGETIVVENNIIKEKTKTPDTPATASRGEEGPSRGRGAGLSGILGQLNQKNKLSTLEKSKLDWVTYKKEEGIEEEIQTHNKGKAGYLDRQDFLERADLRQYEIERDLRMTRRSKR